ncbi:EAL domain-containing protein [Marinobacteraceae bacterium S3BR75-40.1]
MLQAVFQWLASCYRSELIQELYRESRGMLLLAAAATLAVAFLFYPVVQTAGMLWWIIIMTTFYGVGELILWRHGRQLDAASAIAWCREFTVLYVLSGVGYAVGSWLILPHLSHWQEVTYLLIVFAMVITPLPLFTFYLPVSLLNPVIILIPSVIAFLTFNQHGTAGWFYAVIVALTGLGYISKNLKIARSRLRLIDSENALASSRATLSALQAKQMHDHSTGLLNFAGLQERVQQRLAARSEPFTVFGICVDGADELSPTYGQRVARKLLRAVALRLEKLESRNASLAYIGHGEFVAAVASSDNLYLETEVLEQLRELMEAPIRIGSHSLRLTLSIGTAEWPNDAPRVNDVFDLALLAMAEATKAPGITHTRHDDSLRRNIQMRASIRGQMTRAIEQGEFQLHLQPQLDLSTGRVRSAEALLRWNSPSFGSVSPGEFIPVAESSGEIIPLGQWVIEEATRILLEGSLPRDFVLAVNVSVQQFLSPELMETLDRVRQQLAGSDRHLELEITESVLMTEDRSLHQTLSQLPEMGLKLALDDFGTGYSSLSYLSRLNINTLKLDRTFIASLPDNERQASLVESVIQLAQGQKMEMVAEGIETLEQYRWLKAHGCQTGQGFLFCKPLPLRDFAEWLETGAPRWQIISHSGELSLER